MVKRKIKVAHKTNGYSRFRKGKPEHVSKYEKEIDIPELSKKTEKRVKTGKAKKLFSKRIVTTQKGKYKADKGIVDIMQWFNDNNVYTVASCSGLKEDHKREPMIPYAYVGFKKSNNKTYNDNLKNAIISAGWKYEEKEFLDLSTNEMVKGYYTTLDVPEETPDSYIKNKWIDLTKEIERNVI